MAMSTEDYEGLSAETREALKRDFDVRRATIEELRRAFGGDMELMFLARRRSAPQEEIGSGGPEGRGSGTNAEKGVPEG